MILIRDATHGADGNCKPLLPVADALMVALGCSEVIGGGQSCCKQLEASVMHVLRLVDDSLTREPPWLRLDTCKELVIARLKFRPDTTAQVTARELVIVEAVVRAFSMQAEGVPAEWCIEYLRTQAAEAQQ